MVSEGDIIVLGDGRGSAIQLGYSLILNAFSYSSRQCLTHYLRACSILVPEIHTEDGCMIATTKRPLRRFCVRFSQTKMINV